MCLDRKFFFLLGPLWPKAAAGLIPVWGRPGLRAAGQTVTVTAELVRERVGDMLKAQDLTKLII